MPNILVSCSAVVLTEAELEAARLSLFRPCHLFVHQSGDGDSFNRIIFIYNFTPAYSCVYHIYICILLRSKGWWLSLILITVPCTWVLIGDFPLWPCWLTCLWCRLYLALSPFHSGSLTHKGRSEALSVNSSGSHSLPDTGRSLVHFLHCPCWRHHTSLNNVPQL